MERNFSFTIPEGYEHAGATLWSGRYCVCLAMCIAITEDNTYVLVNKRGIGAPNNQGKWNCPVGFMEIETSQECCARETLEETGIEFDPKHFDLYSVTTDPEKDKHVILTHLLIYTDNDLPKIDMDKVKELSEPHEVADACWMPVELIDRHEWAFNHDQRIKEALNTLYELSKKRKR